MQAEMIDLLSHKGKFSTEQALVLAEAIDMGISNSQLVTVPVMDMRFEVVNSRFSAVDAQFAKIDARFDAVDARFEKVDARFEAVDAQFKKVDARFEAVDARFAALETKIERLTHRLIIAMLVSQTALGPVGMAALEAAHRALATFFH